jgi:hypothetical protein
MSSPRDRDGFDERGPGEWQEPEHLGEGSAGPAGPPEGASTRPAEPAEPAGSTAWQPAGWDLPTVEPDRAPAPRWNPPAVEQRQSDAGQVFVAGHDPMGVQGWALHHGWVPSDGSGPQDAPLAELVRSAPVRPSRDDRPGNVVRGRGMGLDLVAFDVVYTSGRYAVPRWAVTAAPVLGEVPGFRLSPARFWKHRIGGLLQIPSGDPEFDLRWVLLAPEDSPQLRRLVEDPMVRQLLLGSDDGDELWSAAGFVAAVRPDGHRPLLIEHHARLLAVVVGALAAAA